ncbi:flagellar basal body L-ring protein FlgH [Granulicella aggregans]|uniref:Flagellar basal body L-ring protein FlgH n=1 Tax=Granulicella aggregans TaxID=474949 RepID=A0A7W7ZDD7_9BACT|nr:flagellar basal body L-ring protein FlgH [Granulicella aggregans]
MKIISDEGSSGWIVRTCLVAWWLMAATALSQTAPPAITPPATPGSAPVAVQSITPASGQAATPVVIQAPGAAGRTSTRPAASSRISPRTVSRPSAQASAASAAAQAAPQPAPSVPATPSDSEPPPPYPVAAKALPSSTTDPGFAGVPLTTPIMAAAPPPGKRTMLKKLVPANPNIAVNSLNAYVERLRRETSSAQPAAGAIWSESGRLTRLNTDVRAMRPNDLIQVVVLENLAASTDGTVKNQRASAANSSISSLIGALHASNALQNLVNQSSSNSLNAAGASATNSSLTTTFGGQVIEVLPNGMLVIEAARQVEFSQQTQTIILRGLVRPEDISQENQVKSTAISSLELEVKGKGIVNDYTRRQNPLVRLLQQILIF